MKAGEGGWRGVAVGRVERGDCKRAKEGYEREVRNKGRGAKEGRTDELDCWLAGEQGRREGKDERGSERERDCHLQLEAISRRSSAEMPSLILAWHNYSGAHIHAHMNMQMHTRLPAPRLWSLEVSVPSGPWAYSELKTFECQIILFHRNEWTCL